MCLLTYFPPNAEVDASALSCGADCNPHGHGFAVVTPMGIVVEKSLTDPEALIQRFIEVRAQFPDTDALFHSRITTHGETSLENCHPFYVAHMGDTVLAHNGVLPGECTPRKGDPRSDTRVLADGYMNAQFVALDNDKTRVRMEKWLGRGSKVLVLTTNPRYRKNAYLFNAKLGEWAKGVWYSNDSYLPYVTSWGSYVSYGKHAKTQEKWWETIDTGVSRTESGIYYAGGREGYALDPWEISRTDRLFANRVCTDCGAHGQINRFVYFCEWCWSCWICGKSVERPCSCETREGGAPEYLGVSERIAWRADIDNDIFPDFPSGVADNAEVDSVGNAAVALSGAAEAALGVGMGLTDTAAKLIALRSLTAGKEPACDSPDCCPEGA